ncbi:Double Clp-N motif-containing P-loop nucleoside triphosphate hydrolases superfamily protein [Rhynchospora pubera]|uniref:Double Clp-N motif-containing P-loop nucleoside triphosphate hydrolases superfamily protein n=1 Tax=Rhynchospora pubera TaxID=906938 RepID=A0AAV8FZ87_9POAL|nr:Double Clp-N motif-containing P-loop nucleoside triphosphate hydrolases superfamily protein [Rhynchospora pubera]
MRAGGCTVQQALTADAATVVKQSVNLARRRGHAQVTPLHVASMMLSSAGLLRAACLQSHSHPLQCKALELCFNVALNRLPTSSTILTTNTSHHHHIPTLSNALIAAFKRAQAHQRRGSVESQQQPLLAVKIELGQLIISILDDPSVSRVMREAGFSSTQVKSHVEKAVMVEASSSPDKGTNNSGNKSKEATLIHGNKVMSHVKSEDVVRVLNCLSSGNKKSVIVVGECIELSQGLIKVVMDKIAKGEVPDGLKNTELIPLPLSSFRIMTREEVEDKLLELRSLVRSCCLGRRGALFILEDFKWACEAWENICFEKQRGHDNYSYSPIEHMIMEISSLINSTSNERVWLLGFCTNNSYVSCKHGKHSLETLWCLHSFVISDIGGLGLSLCESDAQNQLKSKGYSVNGSCLSISEGGALGSHTARSGECCTNDKSNIPAWLQHNINEKKTSNNIDQVPLQLKDYCLKWNTSRNSSLESQSGRSSELTLSFSTTTPMSANPTLHHLPYQPSPLSFDNSMSWRDHCVWLSGTDGVHGKYCTMSYSNPNSNTNSSASDNTAEYLPKFKELNAENLKSLCNALEKRVPWQKVIIPDIASRILQCRSGMMRRKEKLRVSSGVREETWFLFQGRDNEGKESIARELANLVFGSQNHFVLFRFGAFSPTNRSITSQEDIITNKRPRCKNDHGYIEQVFHALHDNPHRVIFMEDVDQLDYNGKMCIKSAIEGGVIRNGTGEEVSFHDSIVVLSCDAFNLRTPACSPRTKHKANHENESASKKEADLGFCLDLNLCADDNSHECCYDDVGLLDVVDQVFCFD